ncbi:MAG: hypothetical protein EXR98_00105 [Gemmataceae bacterium]|nr:hypothetical protein [Gemmataceae bacterium]
MTVRQLQGTGKTPALVANGSDAGMERSAQFSWETWFRHANSQQRAEALGLAQQQGVLYPHQLPAATNGVKPVAAPARDSEASSAIARILAGKPESLPYLSIETLSVFDTDLDELQRQAVARALSTPDLFLLQGLPGTGKSRTLAELLRQAASHGRRVLLLAGHTASLDVVLQRLIGRPEILALRFLDTHEKAETLAAGVRSFTLEQQQKAFLERTLLGVRSKHGEADSACRQRRDLEPVWSELGAYQERCDACRQRLQTLDGQVATLSEVVERDADGSDTPFAAGISALRKSGTEATQTLAEKLRTDAEGVAQCDQEIAQLKATIAQNQPAYDAKKHGRFWTLAYWTNLFNGAIIQEMETLLEHHAGLQARRQTVVQQIDQVANEQGQLRERFTQERAALIGGELALCQAAFLSQRQAIESEDRRLDDEWNALCGRLGVPAIEKTRASLELARTAWLAQKKYDEQQCQFAQEWKKFVEETGAQLAARLPSFANVLAGTISRWNADAKFRDAAGATIDLLIVEDTNALSEVELLKLARLAPRCVLVGQSITETVSMPPGCWHRLWNAAGGESGRWPSTWQRVEGRLVCQLIPLTAEDRRHLDCEGLADAPDIELGILQRPQARPCLAQVVFGPNCSFADAFTFMVREVQEFPLQPLGCTAWWSEDAQRHTRHLGPQPGRIHTWVEIEPGLRLGVVANKDGEATCAACLEFDKAAGWDRPKAEEWLHRHRALADHERTAFLQMPHRYAPSLAKIVQSVVRANDWLIQVVARPEDPATRQRVGNGSSFEFVAVPPLAKTDWPRDGAGQELDLTTPRSGERLPVGLRNGLPVRGYVNYAEAQALIRALEGWTREASAAPTCRVAVLALYEGQVELLRRLVEQSEILRARNFPLEVALPSRLHQRECDIVFLSLTRSHAYRAVAYGEDVKELPLALTRARSRLLIFGDPGSLFNLAGWHGPLEALDAQAAQQDLLGVSRLLAYLQSLRHAPAHANGKN